MNDDQSNCGNSFYLTIWTLWKRELVRFFRQKNRVVGAFLTPLMFWLMIGLGIGNAYRPASAPEGMSYIEYFYPGTILMIMLFTAIFSTISIIEDRREGFLQAVLVAPVSRIAIVLGKVLGGTSLAMIQGLIFCVLAPLLGIKLTLTSVLEIAGILLLLGLGLTGLGYLVAWPMDSTQGFHAIMNVFLMPLWLLSGSLFSPDSAPLWLQWIMKLNPLTYGLSGLRHAFYPANHSLLSTLPSLLTSCLVMAGFAIFTIYVSHVLTGRKVMGGRA